MISSVLNVITMFVYFILFYSNLHKSIKCTQTIMLLLKLDKIRIFLCFLFLV